MWACTYCDAIRSYKYSSSDPAPAIERACFCSTNPSHSVCRRDRMFAPYGGVGIRGATALVAECWGLREQLVGASGSKHHHRTSISTQFEASITWYLVLVDRWPPRWTIEVSLTRNLTVGRKIRYAGQYVCNMVAGFRSST